MVVLQLEHKGEAPVQQTVHRLNVLTERDHVFLFPSNPDGIVSHDGT